MKRILVGTAALLAIGLLEAPAPAQAQEAWSRGEQGWYIGFGLGGGSGRVESGGDTATESGGGMFMFKVGGVLSDNFLLGFEMGAWRKEFDDDVAIQFNHYDVMATWFPSATAGGFLKAGVGLGVPVVEVDGDTDTGDSGVDVRLGAGWEFRLGQSFHLGVELVSSATSQEDVDYVGDVGLLATFSWY